MDENSYHSYNFYRRLSNETCFAYFLIAAVTAVAEDGVVGAGFGFMATGGGVLSPR